MILLKPKSSHVTLLSNPSHGSLFHLKQKLMSAQWPMVLSQWGFKPLLHIRVTWKTLNKQFLSSAFKHIEIISPGGIICDMAQVSADFKSSPGDCEAQGELRIPGFLTSWSYLSTHRLILFKSYWFHYSKKPGTVFPWGLCTFFFSAEYACFQFLA